MTKSKGLSVEERKQVRLQNLKLAREKKLELLKQKKEDEVVAKEVDETVKQVSVDIPNNEYTYDYSYSEESEELVVQPKKKDNKKKPKAKSEPEPEPEPVAAPVIEQKADNNNEQLKYEIETIKKFIMGLKQPAKTKKPQKKSSKTTINIVNPSTREKKPMSESLKQSFLKF